MRRVNVYNADFAWRNGFGGGLHPKCATNSRFAGVDPESERFVELTGEVQASQGLKVDGWFGPRTFDRYKVLYGPPTLEVKGYDISGHQRPDDQIPDLDDVNMVGLKARGFHFVIIKAMEGVNKGLSQFCKEHTQAAIDACIDFTHYDFATPWTGFKNDAKAEAERFMWALEELPEGRLLPSFDHENKGYKLKDGKVKYGAQMYELWQGRRGGGRAEYMDRMTDWTLDYLEHFKQLFGQLPMLYSYPSFLRNRLHVEGIIGECPLWLAAYVKGDPRKKYRIDAALHLVCQQYTSSGDDSTREVFEKDLDLNRAPWGLGPMMR